MWSASRKYGFVQPSSLTAASAAARVCTRLRADNHVLPVGLVPHRHHLHTRFTRLHTRRELRLRLVRKPVPHTHRKSGKLQSLAHTFKHPKINRLIGRTTSAVQHTHLTTNPQTPGSRRRPLSSRSGLGTPKVPAQDSRCKRSPRHPPRSTRPSSFSGLYFAIVLRQVAILDSARTLDLLPSQVPRAVPDP